MIQQQGASAQIFQFPVGGRSGQQRALADSKRPLLSDLEMPRGSALGAGESWYHAEAIQAAQSAAT